MTTQKAYSQEQAEGYDDRHFGGRSGRHILARDCAALESLLAPPPGAVLDVPCGTGVYSAALVTHGYSVVAADASQPMLDLTTQRAAVDAAVLCDITHLPFPEGMFDAVTTLRLLSHFEVDGVARTLPELRRVIRPGGRVVFDTFRWTPRRWPVFRRILNPGHIHVLSHSEVQKLIREAGLTLVEARHMYLYSPLWQRRLPLPVLHVLEAVEKRLPSRWLLRTLWACTKD
ncbi:MAG TPA: class I SAM-dependent methyltransferase [Anaerolineae bacterium]|nr:class I SAM-dependent methyltransferase [Anaerolineae bacterium]